MRRRAAWVVTTSVLLAAASGCELVPKAQPPAPAAPPPATVTVTKPADNATEAPESTDEQTTGQDDSASTETVGEPCTTAQLRARLYPDTLAEMSKQPDDTSTRVRLANVGSSPCTLSGAAKVEFIGQNGESLPSRMWATHAGPSPKTVTLATREGAVQNMWWEIFNTDDRYKDAACSDPAQVRITPPGNTESIVLDWKLGAVCNGGLVEHGPFKKG